MNIGNLIKERRTTLGITQKEIADYVGVSEGTVSRWESANISNMRRDRIAKLAEILRVPPTVIMGVEETKPKEAPLYDLLEVLFKDSPDFLAKLKQLSIDGELNEPDVYAKLNDKQKYRMKDIISFTYNEAVQQAPPREPHEDAPAQQEPADTPPQQNPDGTYTVTVHPDDWKALEELKKRESLMSAASISTGEKRA